MRQLWEIANFSRSVRRRMRFGEFSRAPLRLLRLEWQSNSVECDWIARPPDVWDESLRRAERDRNQSLQTLVDAMAMRDLLFEDLPGVESAVLRCYRQPTREPPELIVLGSVSREAPYVRKVPSVAMRAKLYGFCFCLDDGFLRPLEVAETQQGMDHHRQLTQ